MQQVQSDITVETSGPGLYEFTASLSRFVSQSAITDGLLTIFCRHTSASLVIQENADPDVRQDLQDFYTRLVPEGMAWVRHTCEGPDDMPAHIKSALTATTLSIPVSAQRMALGTWQGVYLFEHRTRSHQRRIRLHLFGE